MNATPAVRHNTSAHRYEVDLGGLQAVADYELDGDRQIFTHTYVPPEMRGQGIAEALVRQALEDAKAANRKVVPACSYVAVFIERNKQYQDLIGS